MFKLRYDEKTNQNKRYSHVFLAGMVQHICKYFDKEIASSNVTYQGFSYFYIFESTNVLLFAWLPGGLRHIKTRQLSNIYIYIYIYIYIHISE